MIDDVTLDFSAFFICILRDKIYCFIVRSQILSDFSDEQLLHFIMLYLQRLLIY